MASLPFWSVALVACSACVRLEAEPAGTTRDGEPPDAAAIMADAGPGPDAAHDAGAGLPDAAVDRPDAAVDQPDAAVDQPDAAVDRPDAGQPIPLTLRRVGETFEIPTIAAAAPKRSATVAYDPDADAYLVVHGNAVIGGAYVSADGVPMGAPLQVNDPSDYAQWPQLAYSPEARAFLVTWQDTRGGGTPHVRGRLVGLAGGVPSLLSADFRISSNGTSYHESPAAVAYSRLSQEFIVVWQTSGMHAQRISTTGDLLGPAIELHPDGTWNSQPSVTHHPSADEFYVAWSHASDTARIHGRRVKAGTGALIGGTATLATATGTWLPTVALDSRHLRYLCAWWEGRAGARLVAADGALSPSTTIAAGYGSYDGLHVAYNAAAGVFAAVMHGDSAEDFAAVIGPDGETGPVIAATASPAGTDGNYNPRVAAHGSRREWLLVTVRGYTAVVGQRIGVE